MRKEVKTGAQLALVTTLAVAASNEASATGTQINENFSAKNSLFIDTPNTPDFQQIEATPTPSFMVETQVPGGRVRLYPDAGDSNNIYAEVAANTQFRVRGKLNTQSAEGGNADYWFLVELDGGQFGWINQLVVPQALEQLNMVPDLVDVVQMPVMQNGQIMLDQQGIPQRLLEVNYALGGTIDMARLASVWGDPALPLETYNPANLAVADNLGEVIVQMVDITRPDGGVNPAGSVILLPEVTFPDGSTNVQPLFLNKADIEANLGMAVNFETNNAARGSLRLASATLFNYERFANDRVSGVNVNTAFYQSLVVSAEGDFPSSIFEFDAQFTRVTFTTGETYELSLGDDGYWLAVRAAAVEFNASVDRYVWGQEVSARRVEGTTYELTIGGKVLRVDYPQGLPFGTESSYLFSRSGFFVTMVGIYLGQSAPHDIADPNEYQDIYVALPTETGQCLAVSAGTIETDHGYLTYFDPGTPGYRTSPNYTNNEFSEIVDQNMNVGDLVQIGFVDPNMLTSANWSGRYKDLLLQRYGYNSIANLEGAVGGLLNQAPGSCSFMEAGPLIGIFRNPLLGPRVTGNSS